MKYLIAVFIVVWGAIMVVLSRNELDNELERDACKIACLRTYHMGQMQLVGGLCFCSPEGLTWTEVPP